MVIHYKNKKIREICIDSKVATKKYGNGMAHKIQQRMQEIDSADSVEMMIQFKIGRCHPLHNDREGQYAVDLIHPHRLVFEEENNIINVVRILEIVDYH